VVNLFAPSSGKSTPPSDGRLPAVEALAEQFDATLRTAEALVRAHRRVDLQGLDQLAGRLCAASLDLPPEQGRMVRPTLVALLSRVDDLEAAMHIHSP
jgi:hypothetical protein